MSEPDHAVTAPLLTNEACDDLLTGWSGVQGFALRRYRSFFGVVIPR